MKNIYIQHQINTFIMQLLYIRKMKAQNKLNSACIVTIIGPPASGKKCFAAYLTNIIKKRIQMSDLELIPVELINTNTLSARQFSELASNMFVSIYLVTCKTTEKSHITLSISSLISPSKLHKTFNITMARLKAFAYNFNMALENDHLMGLSDVQILTVLSNQLYTKRCTSEMHLISTDMDYISFLSTYTKHQDSFPILSIFLNYRPHVNMAFRSHALPKAVTEELTEDPILKKCTVTMLQMQFEREL